MMKKKKSQNDGHFNCYQADSKQLLTCQSGKNDKIIINGQLLLSRNKLCGMINKNIMNKKKKMKGKK